MLDITHKWNDSFKPLIWGFILSLALTFTAYFILKGDLLQGWFAIFAIFTLGTIQALIQLILFMNLGIEPKPRWNLLMFFFMIIVIIVLVGGSIWIMYNLNYNMMMMPDHMQGM